MGALEAHLHGLYDSFGRQACQDLQELETGGSYAALLEALGGKGCADRLSTARDLASHCYGLLQARGLLQAPGLLPLCFMCGTCQVPLVHSLLHADLAAIFDSCRVLAAKKIGCLEGRVLPPRNAAKCFELLPPRGLLPCAVCQVPAAN